MKNSIRVTNQPVTEVKKTARKRKISLSVVLDADFHNPEIASPSFKLKKRSVGGKGLQSGLSFDNMHAIDDLIYG